MSLDVYVGPPRRGRYGIAAALTSRLITVLATRVEKCLFERTSDAFRMMERIWGFPTAHPEGPQTQRDDIPEGNYKRLGTLPRGRVYVCTATAVEDSPTKNIMVVAQSAFRQHDQDTLRNISELTGYFPSYVPSCRTRRTTPLTLTKTAERSKWDTGKFLRERAPSRRK